MRINWPLSRVIQGLIIFSLILPLAGCGMSGMPFGPADIEQVSSDKQRAIPEDVSLDEINKLTDGNLAFSLDMYQHVKGRGDNLFYSPYSISIALAMTYAGARGETAIQMAETLRYVLPPEELHPAFNALDQILESRGEEKVPENAGDPYQLSTANALWGQKDYDFEQEYLDSVAENYGAGMRLLNFLEQTEEARQTINQWVYEKTEEKIENLIPEGGVSADTRLVLTNAIYFKATWAEQFSEDLTQEGDFHTLEGETVKVPMMRYGAPQHLRYLEGEGFQAIELPYVGSRVAMLVIVPDQGMFEDFEGSLNPERVKGIVEGLSPTPVNLTFPKFEIESELSLASVLSEMGMPAAMSAGADFSGMTGTKDLFISDVFHKAFVSVDEEGTEAAAATGVVMFESEAPASPVELTVDRPFFTLIRDQETGAVLFFGRVLDPAR